MRTHNLCFEQKYEKYQNFSSENFHFLVVKFSIYLNRRVFVMKMEKVRTYRLISPFEKICAMSNTKKKNINTNVN